MRLELSPYNKEFKSIVMADIKKCLPKGWKVTMRTHKYAGGCSVTLIVRQVPRAALLELARPDEEVLEDYIHYNRARGGDMEAEFKQNATHYLTLSRAQEQTELKAFDLPIFPSSFPEKLSDLNWGYIPPINYKANGEHAKALAGIVRALNQFNYDKSDRYNDYYNVNYYVHLTFGEWNKPCKVID